jgi:hypothetical protein
MIDIEYIRSFFPSAIAHESRFDRYMLKEYLQLLILDHLATTHYINKVSFIGGTNLRLLLIKVIASGATKGTQELLTLSHQPFPLELRSLATSGTQE